MAIVNVDIVLDIYRSVSTSTAIGTRSPYATIPHPGTGKTIKGWEWDKRTWPSDIEIKATDFAPTIFDPDTNFIPEEQFQSGIGDNDDLKVLQVTEEQASNVRFWTPRLQHGYFYIYDQEWYLYSDDAVKDLFDSTVISGVMQVKELEFSPKPGVPVSVRRYKWNSEKARYEIDLNLRKKLEFTGIVHNEVEEETYASGNYITANIDTSKDEFVLEYSSGVNRIVLNRNYEDQVGVSGTLSSLEFLGISDGSINEYHIPYAPVSPDGTVQLITWDERTGDTFSWSRIPQTSDFTLGGYNEYKLDDYLGIVTFGDYDDNTLSGAGARPGILHQIGLVYTRGLELTYEPDNSRDWLEPRTADTNPFHNPINQGFVKVSSEVSNPQWIQLTANLEGDATNGYETELSNKTATLVATVLDSNGVVMEGETVVFEILSPEFGSFSNLELEAQSLTSVQGEAKIQYVPPATIEDIGRATTVMSDSSGDTLLAVDGLTAPDSVEDIYLFKVMIDDPVGGIPDTEVSDYYTDYLDDEGIDVESDGSAATVETEQEFRDVHDLLTPNTFDANDLVTGTKVIVATVDAGVLDPNYGIQNANDPDYDHVDIQNGLTDQPYTAAPIVPYAKLTSGSNEAPTLELTYSGLLDEIDGTTFKSYFVVCPATTRVRAKVVNAISGKTVYSNIISITTNIPDEASGVAIIDDLNDMQEGLISRVKHIDEVSDSTILETSGELWREYLEDRIYEEDILNYANWPVDSGTIGYWPLESGSLHDSSPYGNHLVNVGGMIPSAGIVGGAYRSRTPGTPQFLDANDLWNDVDLQMGTVDMMFRTDGDTPSGATFRLFEFTVTGSNNRRNSLLGLVEQSNLSGIQFRFNYEVSGVGNPNAYLTYNLLDNGIILTDSEWHSLRVAWKFNEVTSQITLSGQIDGQDMGSGGVPTATLPFFPAIGTVIGGKVQAVAGDLTASGTFYFDEIRWSNYIRTDDWPYSEIVSSGESYIDWFRRSRKADTNRLLLQSMVVSGYAPARLPLGFRLKSTGITVASMLDRVTFVSVNDHLPSDYFD